MKLALLQVDSINYDGTVNGVWLQGCCVATVEEAIQRAKDTEKANSRNIIVAVVDDNFGITDYNFKKNLKRYDYKEGTCPYCRSTRHEVYGDDSFNCLDCQKSW